MSIEIFKLLRIDGSNFALKASPIRAFLRLSEGELASAPAHALPLRPVHLAPLENMNESNI
jgi:hypothetical protein